ncbi:amino acid adenylation domain-containing protein [Photorhabdus laumondii]|uniref:amino acid adenylation domain-containing protein n=1 Tax=Photorhabdus laumondii TaxID=2218628 RepID=UPI0033148CD0
MQNHNTLAFEETLRLYTLEHGALGAYPLSAAQRRLWLLEQLSDAVTMPVTARYQVTGQLDIAVVQLNLSRLIAGTETLRSLFTEVEGKPVRLLMPAGQVQLEFFDTEEGCDVDSGLVSASIAQSILKVFDLKKGPLLRVFIAKISDDEYELVLAGHPIVLDEHSLNLIAESLLFSPSNYHEDVGRSEQSGDLTAIFQIEQARMGNDAVKTAMRHWGQTLQAPAATEIPSEFPRPAVKGTRRKVHKTQLLPTSTAQTLENFVSSWLAVLMRWQGSQSAVCGVKTRAASHSQVIGPLQTFLPVRVDMADDSTLDDIAHQLVAQLTSEDKISFSGLLEICPPKRDVSRTPYFQTGLRYIDTTVPLDTKNGIVLVERPVLLASSDLDLYITCWVGEQGITLVLDYDRDVLSDTVVDTLAEALSTVMLAARNQSIPTVGLMSLQTREKILSLSRGPTEQWEPTTLVDFVAATMQSVPENIAVTNSEQCLTYTELWERSARVAANIQKQVAGRDNIISVVLPRCVDFVATVLGVLRSGNAFLPIDPRLPAERIRFLINNSASSLVITSHAATIDEWPDVPRLFMEQFDSSVEFHVPGMLSEDNAAYVIYTSGSTGQPKGVVVEHKQVVNNLMWRQKTWPLTSKDHVLHNHSFSFDPSIWALFWPLMSGSTIVLADVPTMENSNVLVRLMAEQNVSVFGAVPSLLGALVDHPLASHCQSVRLVLSGGEVLSAELAHKIRSVWQAEVANLYGPTEATIDALYYPVSHDVSTSVPIGYPLLNVDAFVVDPDLNLVPCGVPGEIMIAGRNLARGYLGKPQETALRFLPNPFGAGRLYDTGDLGRRWVSGAISYLGRRDHQVKIRGYRIELNEVAHMIRQVLDISEAIVFALDAGTEHARLVAAMKRGPRLNVDDIHHQLAQRLPGYLVPSQFLLLDKLPRTPTGKIDTLKLSALAVPERPAMQPETECAPSSELEKSVMGDFAQVLGLPAVTPDTDFFIQGGTSILLTRLASKLAVRYQVEIPLHEFFRVPTPAAVAETIEIYRREGLTSLLARQHAQTLEKDVCLDEKVHPAGLPNANWYNPSAVFLTGATGYLGLHLIEQLLKRTLAKVICLCRAKDQEHAQTRILEGLQTYRIDIANHWDRVVCLVGDLSLPHFGLTEQEWFSLTNEVDVIYHNGALVNFVYPYSALKATNVGSTQTILELACTMRLKSVHYVSTVDTLLATHSPRPFIEDDSPLRSAVGVPAGYTGSKWVAEGVANLARLRGIPVSIFRPGLILGHTQTGASQIIDYLLVALRGFLPMGIIPDYPRIFDIVPVDYVAAAIVHISQQPKSKGKFFHLFNPAPVSIRQFCEWIRDFGYEFNIVPFEEGRRRALTVPPGHALYPLVPLILDADPEPHRALDPNYMHEVNPELEGRQTFAFLASSDIALPQTMKEYAHKILRYLIDIDFLAAPDIQHTHNKQES